MKPGNAALGIWEPRIDRQDTHSSLKRHEDKVRKNQRKKREERWEMTCLSVFKEIQYEETGAGVEGQG